MDTILAQVRQALHDNADEKVRQSSTRFFKESLKSYGVKSALVDKISKQSFAQLKGKAKPQIFDLCEDLWRSGYLEESGVACSWSYAVRAQYQPEDFQVWEKWVGSYVSNWAACDMLCNHTVGTFLEMYPDYVPKLKQWARSKNRWMKRAAAVSLIIPARRGLFLADILEIANILLPDPDDMVQKGYGWMLKAASQAHQQEIFRYVCARKTAMPRTAFRYALEKMPPELKAEAMKK